jgi:hypothetical protein
LDFDKAACITVQRALVRVPLVRWRKVLNMPKPKRDSLSVRSVGPNKPAHVAGQEQAKYRAQNRKMSRRLGVQL